jgi:hypothetical protein
MGISICRYHNNIGWRENINGKFFFMSNSPNSNLGQSHIKNEIMVIQSNQEDYRERKAD